jgi:hypothetical protein
MASRSTPRKCAASSRRLSGRFLLLHNPLRNWRNRRGISVRLVCTQSAGCCERRRCARDRHAPRGNFGGGSATARATARTRDQLYGPEPEGARITPKPQRCLPGEHLAELAGCACESRVKKLKSQRVDWIDNELESCEFKDARPKLILFSSRASHILTCQNPVHRLVIKKTDCQQNLDAWTALP